MKKSKNRRTWKVLDVLLFLLIVLCGLAGLIYSTSAPAGSSVLIQTPYGEYRYSADKDRIVTVRGILGKYSIEIRGGAVRALEATCPERICLGRGWIHRSGDSIVCVPNRIIIRMEKKDQEEDAITE